MAACEPFDTLTLAGETVKLKLGLEVALTVKLTAAVCTKVPDVPVTVTVEVPVVAVEPAVSVSVLEVVEGFGLNAAVTPEGNPEAAKVTLPVNPFNFVIVIVLVPPAPPFVIDTLFGDAAKEKFAAAPVVTVRLMVVVCDKLPEVPVIVTVEELAPANAEAFTVSVLVVVPGFGLNAAVTPLGNPDAAKVTLPVNPFCGVIVIVLVLLELRATVKLVGEADSAKFGVALTVKLTVVVCVKLPEVPVIVTVAVPIAAVALAVKVSLLVAVPGFGLNAAVTPLGNPEAAIVTLPVNPFSFVIVMVLDPAAPPCAIVKLVGEAASEKFGAALTVKLTVAVCVKLPEVPVIVTVAAPVVAVPLAVSVSVLVVVVGFVLNAAVTPLGKPLAAKVTLPVNPFCGVTVIVLVPPVPPCVIVTLVGDAASVKLGFADAFTVKLTVVVCVKLPEVPVMVTVAAPVVAEALAVSVKVLVAVAGLLLNPAVTPVGKPEAESVTAPLNPFVGAIVIVLVPPAPPCVIVTLVGEAESEKFGELDPGQAFTKFATFKVPMPVAKSHPVVVP